MNYLKSIYYFFIQIKVELITSLSAFISLIIAYKYTEDIKILLLWSMVIILITTLIVIWIKVQERKFYFVSFLTRKQKSSWLLGGLFIY